MKIQRCALVDVYISNNPLTDPQSDIYMYIVGGVKDDCCLTVYMIVYIYIYKFVCEQFVSL